MIDTDKYTGHTPAPWNADCAEPDAGLIANIDAYGEEGDVCVARMVNGCLADTQLIADAPLILADYKRLRERVKTEKNLKLWEKSEVKRLREETSILKNALRSLLKDKHAEVWYEVNRILEGVEE